MSFCQSKNFWLCWLRAAVRTMDDVRIFFLTATTSEAASLVIIQNEHHLEQVLTHTQTIMSDNKEPEKLITTSTQQTRNDADALKGDIICLCALVPTTWTRFASRITLRGRFNAR